MFFVEKTGELLTISANRPSDDVVETLVAYWQPDRIVRLTSDSDFEAAQVVLAPGADEEGATLPPGTLVLSGTTVVAKDNEGNVVAEFQGQAVYPPQESEL